MNFIANIDFRIVCIVIYLNLMFCKWSKTYDGDCYVFVTLKTENVLISNQIVNLSTLCKLGKLVVIINEYS